MLNRWWGALAMASALAGNAFAASANIERTGGPYVPTPQVVVDQMLQLGNVGPKDFVMDLGAGDGIIVLTAAMQYGARGVGIEIDPQLVTLANERAYKNGVADRARFVQQDIFKTNLSEVTVLTLYLLPAMMLNLRPKLLDELKPGTRIVAHDYHFGDWDAETMIELDVPEKEKVNGIPKAYLRLWIVPARVNGQWQVKTAGSEPIELNLKQQIQNFEGTATVGGRSVKLTQTRVRGEEVSFALPVDAKGSLGRFAGRVRGSAMEGTLEVAGRPPQPFTATLTGGTRTSAAN
jgi:hypothetical protein